MLKQGCLALLLMAISVLLTGCITNVWTGITLVYDRHNVYRKVNDFQLSAKANHALYSDQIFKGPGSSIDLAVINTDILVAGHVPTDALRQEAIKRITTIEGYRRLFNQLAVSSSRADTVLDDWITTKIRSKIFADSTIDPHVFKVVTSDQIVYLMGDVIPSEAKRVVQIASACDGVRRVVTLLKYYNLSDHPPEGVAITKSKNKRPEGSQAD